jgi:hypothetical protein
MTEGDGREAVALFLCGHADREGTHAGVFALSSSADLSIAMTPEVLETLQEMFAESPE